MKLKAVATSFMLALSFSITLISDAATAGSLCNNGTYSTNSGRGTCSSNGGVNKSLPSYSDPGSSSYNRNNGLGSMSNSDPYGFNSSSKSKSNGYSSGLNSDPYGFNSSSKSKSNGYGSSSSLNCSYTDRSRGRC